MKIVSLAPSITNLLIQMNCQDKLEAVSSLNSSEKHKTAGGWVSGPKMSVIREIDPDVVITCDRLQRKVRDKIEEEGFKTAHYEPETLEQVYQHISDLGKLVGAEQTSNKIIQEMKSSFDRIDLKGSRIYCEEWSNPPMASGNWVPGLIRELNGKYIIKEGRSREISKKEIQKFDPELISLNICGNEETSPNEIKSRTGYKDLNAVKNDRIVVINDSFLNQPTHNLIKGAKKLEKALK